MQLLSNLQFTINSIFDLYRDHGRKYYNFSLLFTIFSSLFCVVFATLVLAATYAIREVFGGSSFGISQLGSNPMFRTDLVTYMPQVLVFVVALFALFLHSRIGNETEKMTFAAFFKSISGKIWTITLLVATLYIPFAILTTELIFSVTEPNGSSMGSLLTVLGKDGRSPLETWVVSVVQLVLTALPVILAYIIIRLGLRQRGMILEKREANMAFFALLIVGFCITTLSGRVVSFVGFYVLQLIAIPFQEPLIPGILSMVVYIFLMAVFYPAIAGSAVYPFLYRHADISANTTTSTES